MAKITFSGSFINSLPIGRGCGRDNLGRTIKSDITCVFCNYAWGADKVCIIIPSELWCDVIVTINGLTVDLADIYPPEINTIMRKAIKLFPNFRG